MTHLIWWSLIAYHWATLVSIAHHSCTIALLHGSPYLHDVLSLTYPLHHPREALHLPLTFILLIPCFPALQALQLDLLYHHPYNLNLTSSWIDPATYPVLILCPSKASSWALFLLSHLEPLLVVLYTRGNPWPYSWHPENLTMPMHTLILHTP